MIKALSVALVRYIGDMNTRFRDIISYLISHCSICSPVILLSFSSLFLLQLRKISVVVEFSKI